MDRRTFLRRSALLAAGGFLAAMSPTLAEAAVKAVNNGSLSFDSEAYKRFKNSEFKYHPYVRWWWNGDKVEADELIRELHLLKEAGIAGVEINPIAFPTTGDDLGKRSLRWLSDEWIDMLKVTFDEAKRLDMTCDLLVGSGWPFGSEELPEDERAQVVLVDAERIEGPTTFEISKFTICKNVDPGVTDVNPLRTFDILSLKLVPNPMSGIDQAIDLSDQIGNEVISVDVPEGKFVFYALVRVKSFACVINGAPGAAGSILDHMNKKAVRKYLDHMAETIERRIGPLKNYIRAMFTDSMELEGCNWTGDFAEQFRLRRGYDLMPYLPFMMFKVGRLGDVLDYNYGAQKTPEFKAELERVRFDYELTKAELLKERFTDTYTQWCADLGVKSRAQAYGRGFFPLESSLGYDIPEGESWTTNWLKHRLGEEMRDDEYRAGRGYTMIDKYVSSAAHLTGKRVVSCEEMTNTYLCFRATLELIKIGSDMSAISGITHSVWHGFNYSPADAPFPGWVQYGSYYNENNTWWPYFKYLNAYKGRLSSMFQNADMYTDMIILPPNYDMWGEIGVQTEPFPGTLNVLYTSLIWEAICKNGGQADYTSEIVLNASTVKNGKLCYGPKQYGTLFLPEVTSTTPATLEKLYEFVSQGGRVFCIEKLPAKSLGFKDYKKRDAEIEAWVKKLQTFPDRFILVKKPEDNKFVEWYADLIEQYRLPHYLTIENPDRFFMQTRWKGEDSNTFFFMANVHMHNSYKSRITFSNEITRGRYPWVWDPDTGKRYRLTLEDGGFELELGPAETIFIVFDTVSKGEKWQPLPTTTSKAIELKGWDVELQHAREGWTKTDHMETITDLKETQWVDFAGTVIYRTQLDIAGAPDKDAILNLGKVYGISQLFVNGEDCGVKWFGNRIYPIGDKLHTGSNEIELRVVTVLGNYMHSLTDNETAQKFTAGRKEWPTLSLGIVGPVTLY